MSKRKHKNHERKKIQPINTVSTSRTLIDIIIPVYGRFDLLEKCLASIPDAVGDLTYDVILVDNNSPERDEFYDGFFWKNTDHKNKTVIYNKENLGFPRACNIGSQRKNSPLLFFLNSDVILRKDAIVNAVKAIDDPKIGVVGMKLIFPSEDLGTLDSNTRPAGKVQHVGLCTNIRGNFYHIFIGWSPDHPKVLATREVYAVTGAALLTRRAIWNKIGGFNEIYGGGTYEDVDFCLSARDLGYNVIVEQSAMGIHYTNGTAEFYKIGYPLQQNMMTFMSRWATRLNYTEYMHW